MISSYFLRDFLNLAVIIPAALFAVLPLVEDFSPKVYAAVLAVLVTVCLAGAYVCGMCGAPLEYMLAAEWTALFAGYMCLVKGDVFKKLFCFFNAAMLCEFCSICAIYITAPYRLLAVTNMPDNFMPALPPLVYLGMSLPIGLVFWKTLCTKLPVLLNEEHIAPAWRYMFMIPLVMCMLIWWLTPIRPLVVMTGRTRQVGFTLVLFVIITVWMSYHILWRLTAKFTESARLQQENTFLQMEAKRYSELKEYMKATRTLRHDFRQHILVIQQLTEDGQLDKLKEYLSDLTEQAAHSYENYCANHAVDAIASHYSRIAQDTRINWRLDLPEVLPVKESDFCAMLGNLVENALIAVKPLPSGSRRVNVISSMLSRFMLGLSIDNPFAGKIELGKDSLPLSGDEEHGMGLISVMSTVKRYGGTMNISAENNVFSVDIILYCNS